MKKSILASVLAVLSACGGGGGGGGGNASQPTSGPQTQPQSPAAPQFQAGQVFSTAAVAHPNPLMNAWSAPAGQKTACLAYDFAAGEYLLFLVDPRTGTLDTAFAPAGATPAGVTAAGNGLVRFDGSAVRVKNLRTDPARDRIYVLAEEGPSSSPTAMLYAFTLTGKIDSAFGSTVPGSASPSPTPTGVFRFVAHGKYVNGTTYSISISPATLDVEEASGRIAIAGIGRHSGPSGNETGVAAILLNAKGTVEKFDDDPRFLTPSGTGLYLASTSASYRIFGVELENGEILVSGSELTGKPAAILLSIKDDGSPGAAFTGLKAMKGSLNTGDLVWVYPHTLGSNAVRIWVSFMNSTVLGEAHWARSSAGRVVALYQPQSGTVAQGFLAMLSITPTKADGTLTTDAAWKDTFAGNAIALATGFAVAFTTYDGTDFEAASAVFDANLNLDAAFGVQKLGAKTMLAQIVEAVPGSPATVRLMSTDYAGKVTVTELVLP